MAIPAPTAPNTVAPAGGYGRVVIGDAALVHRERDRILVTKIHRTEAAIHGPALA